MSKEEVPHNQKIIINALAEFKRSLFDILDALPQTDTIVAIRYKLIEEKDVNKIFGIANEIMSISINRIKYLDGKGEKHVR